MKQCRRCRHREQRAECVVGVMRCCECPGSQTVASAAASNQHYTHDARQ